MHCRSIHDMNNVSSSAVLFYTIVGRMKPRIIVHGGMRCFRAFQCPEQIILKGIREAARKGYAKMIKVSARVSRLQELCSS